ncbi:hypothetical protein FPV67DRAFT_113735 [Lyophyllum atratum]|nr:hypothetical protein FPV67DRAFT_113735 [Lyophyllum atratum]
MLRFGKKTPGRSDPVPTTQKATRVKKKDSKDRLILDRDIPDDIILLIAEHLSTLERLQCCQVSRRMHSILLRPLYEFIDIRSADKCRSLMKVLRSNPSIRYIRSLSVRPYRVADWVGSASDKALNLGEFVLLLRGTSERQQFACLHTFDWVGAEAPEDELWIALRQYCPQLRRIGTTVGPRTCHIEDHSHLFSFQGLLSFSFTTSVAAKWPVFFDGKDLPPRFWQFLLTNCPNLEELTLEGTRETTQLYNIRRVLNARWPHLKILNLGSLSFRGYREDDEKMRAFISAHPSLENVKFIRGMYYSHVSMFYLPALPSLQSFTGRLQQLKLAPHLPNLKELCLTDWFDPAARFAQMLRPFPGIASLAISVNFLDSVDRKDCLGLYKRVVAACPELAHLEVSSTGPVVLKDFSQALRLGPKLQSFVVTRTHKPFSLDSDMGSSAIRIANQYPGLRSFTIRDVLYWDHHDQLNGRCRFKHEGVYSVVHGEGPSAARILKARETSVNSLGWKSTRSSVSELQP